MSEDGPTPDADAAPRIELSELIKRAKTSSEIPVSKGTLILLTASSVLLMTDLASALASIITRDNQAAIKSLNNLAARLKDQMKIVSLNPEETAERLVQMTQAKPEDL